MKTSEAVAWDASMDLFRKRNEAVKKRIALLKKSDDTPSICFIAFDDEGEQFRYEVPLLDNKRVEAQENLFVRLIEHDEDETVLLCEAEESLCMPRHYHWEYEYVYIISGQMRDNVTGDIFSIGGSALFPKKCLHEPEFLMPTKYLMVFRPGLPVGEHPNT
jgi:hypothetical protein